MTKQHIHVGVEATDQGFEHFVNARQSAMQGHSVEPEIRLNFENLPMLLSLLTPARLNTLKVLHQQVAVTTGEQSE